MPATEQPEKSETLITKFADFGKEITPKRIGATIISGDFYKESSGTDRNLPSRRSIFVRAPRISAENLRSDAGHLTHIAKMNKTVFSVSVLVSSFLLFLIQPLVGRMLLPSLGGAPSVWNTCVLFFQLMLLLGYGYTHFATNRLSLRQQVLVHWGLLGLVCLVLPIQLLQSWKVPTESSPIGWLIGQLMFSVGIPFLVVSSNAPLLQRWYSSLSSSSGQSKDPYFLYAISNVGSLGALVAYPFLIEPIWGIKFQAVLWLFGFLVLVINLLICGYLVLKNNHGIDATRTLAGDASAEKTVRLSWSKRIQYIVLAAIPSSLMLGVTTYLTTDVGSFPLIWILPLILYLITFIIVFADRKIIPHKGVVFMVPRMLVVMPVVCLADLGGGPMLMMSIHLSAFFLIALFCHGELSRLRPKSDQLTEFYLLMSIGGAIGGAFNAIVAPSVFNDVLEYPLMLIAAAVFLPNLNATIDTNRWLPRFSRQDLGWMGAMIGLIAVCYGIKSGLRVEHYSMSLLILFGAPAVVCFSTAARPERFALCFAVLLIGSSITLTRYERLTKERGFFGVNDVSDDRKNGYRRLINGRTLHGMQKLDQTSNPEPLSYYHRKGPVGDIFRLHQLPRDASVGVVGLGIGSVASYAQANQKFDFYEIDPVVCKLALDTRYFNFLSSCKAEHQIILGDARIQLAKGLTQGADHVGAKYDLLILDAFSSDSIPTHLITRDAMELYLKRLKPNGLIAIHISNKFVDLRPVIKGLEDNFGLFSAMRFDQVGPYSENDGRFSAAYVVLGTNKEIVSPFLETGSWKPVESPHGVAYWTDDHSNMFDVLNWIPFRISTAAPVATPDSKP